jgi:uncharacterized membrane protein (DUF106 family)
MMFQRILENPVLAAIITLFIVTALIFAYHTKDCNCVEAWERIQQKKKNRQLRRRQMRNKRERVDLTRLVVTKKKNTGNGPELM